MAAAAADGPWAISTGLIAGFMTWFLFGFGILLDQIWAKRPLREACRRNSGSPICWAAACLCWPRSSTGWLGIWGTSVGYLGESFLVDMTIEYQSPNFHLYRMWPFLFSLPWY